MKKHLLPFFLFAIMCLVNCSSEEEPKPDDEQTDLENPTISFTNNLEILYGTYPIEFDLSDDLSESAEITIELEVDGTLVSSVNGDASLELKTTDFDDGDHELVLRATDESGNQSEIKSTVLISNVLMTVKVDENFQENYESFFIVTNPETKETLSWGIVEPGLEKSIQRDESTASLLSLDIHRGYVYTNRFSLSTISNVSLGDLIFKSSSNSTSGKDFGSFANTLYVQFNNQPDHDYAIIQNPRFATIYSQGITGNIEIGEYENSTDDDEFYLHFGNSENGYYQTVNWGELTSDNVGADTYQVDLSGISNDMTKHTFDLNTSNDWSVSVYGFNQVDQSYYNDRLSIQIANGTNGNNVNGNYCWVPNESLRDLYQVRLSNTIDGMDYVRTSLSNEIDTEFEQADFSFSINNPDIENLDITTSGNPDFYRISYDGKLDNLFTRWSFTSKDLSNVYYPSIPQEIIQEHSIFSNSFEDLYSQRFYCNSFDYSGYDFEDFFTSSLSRSTSLTERALQENGAYVYVYASQNVEL